MTITIHPHYENCSEMSEDLQALELETELYDEDCIKPTSYAFAHMRNLLTQACMYVCIGFPLGTAYPDGDGGLRVDWVHSEKELRLIVPSEESGRQYIWHMNGMDHSLTEDVTAKNLGYWLDWLINDDEQTTK